MTSSYHKPTHTFKAGAYNATQVRLYGIHNQEIDRLRDGSIDFGKYSIKITVRENGSKKESENILVDSIRIMKKTSTGAIFLAFSVDEDDKKEPDKKNYDKKPNKTVSSIGIIYGYSYEGHCYDLPKPAIMLLPVLPVAIPDNDCGYDKKKDEKYKVWVVDKLDECDHIEFSSGFVEQLILDTNLPGRRSPSTYRATMQLAHRSGRLTD